MRMTGTWPAHVSLYHYQVHKTYLYIKRKFKRTPLRFSSYQPFNFNSTTASLSLSLYLLKPILSFIHSLIHTHTLTVLLFFFWARGPMTTSFGAANTILLKDPKLQIPSFVHGGLLRPSSNSLALTTATRRRHTHLLSSSSSSSHVIRAVSTVRFFFLFILFLKFEFSLCFRFCSCFSDLFGCRESVGK